MKLLCCTQNYSAVNYISINLEEKKTYLRNILHGEVGREKDPKREALDMKKNGEKKK